MNCSQCSIGFEITDADRQFYDKVSPIIAGKKYPIPEPTLCSACRMQRRMMWRGELNLFKRRSDLSGKEILTFYPSEAKCKVYSVEEWWSDQWDELSYGRDFDFNRPFFEQFEELMEVVPLISRTTTQTEENSDYTNCASWNKNCYLIAAANYNEDCYYGNFINNCKNCTDNSFLLKCELCYECIDCSGGYNLKYSYNCHGCSDSYFLHNCRNCHHCFGSVNLVNKEYYFMNKPLSKEEYSDKIVSLQLDRRSHIREAQQFFEKHRLGYPQKFMTGDMNENVSGNGINQSRNAFDCFDVNNIEDCQHCIWLNDSKSCMDIYAWGFTAELCYECVEAGDHSYECAFSVTSYGSKNTFYSYFTKYSEDIFGCIGMRKKRYCILNKQYTKEEYETLVPKIIEHMKETGEWGQFFPIPISRLAYNTSIAQDYFPLSKEEVLKRGWKWHEYKSEYAPSSNPYPIPDSVKDVKDDIVNQILICSATGRSFKLTPQEFRFYKANNIPIPDRSFQVRHQDRLRQRNPRRLWDRACQKCQAPIKTSYAPDRPEIVYCEACYLKEVY